MAYIKPWWDGADLTNRSFWSTVISVRRCLRRSRQFDKADEFVRRAMAMEQDEEYLTPLVELVVEYVEVL